MQIPSTTDTSALQVHSVLDRAALGWTLPGHFGQLMLRRGRRRCPPPETQCWKSVPAGVAGTSEHGLRHPEGLLLRVPIQWSQLNQLGNDGL